ncbi:hypothetical protein HDU93_008712 [Gonapodya sp. JEL0774]|nr:hypothetical protein HDU93_008712 [Gonapodya sp. JEL0774]
MGKEKQQKVAANREHRKLPRSPGKDDGPKALTTQDGVSPSLLEEILALGGTREDLDFIADVLSDEEEIAMSGLSSEDVAERKKFEQQRRAFLKDASKAKQKQTTKRAGSLTDDIKTLILELGLKPSMAFENEEEAVEDPKDSTTPLSDEQKPPMNMSANSLKIMSVNNASMVTEGHSKVDHSLVADVQSFLSELKEPTSSGKEEANELAKHRKSAVVGVQGSFPTIHSPEEAPNINTKTKKGKLLIAPTPQWFTLHDKFPAIVATEHLTGKKRSKPSLPDVQESRLRELHERATKLLEEEWTKYEQANPTLSASDSSFLSHVLHSGTTSDRLSALSVLVQSSPLHTYRTLEKLVHLCRKKSKRDAALALDTVKEVLTRFILPERKLRYFRDWREVGEYAEGVRGDIRSEWLALWAFEDLVKKLYWEVVKIIEELSHDVLEHIRSKMITHIYDLLASKPEQEQNLLALLVNKMGDPSRPLASKAIHHIHLLLKKHTHPVFKLIVASEIERLLFRPNVATRTRYYAIVCLNQMELRRGTEGIGAEDDADIKCANKLIGVYFGVFEEIMGEKGTGKPSGGSLHSKSDKPNPKSSRSVLSMDAPSEASGSTLNSKSSKGEDGGGNYRADLGAQTAKMMSALLTGINRAFPYSKLEDEDFEKYVATLFRLAHNPNFVTALHAMTLLQLISSHRSTLSDRFYRALFELLFHAGLPVYPRPAALLNVMYKSLRTDHSVARVAAFAKRLLQLAGYASIPLACGILVLVGEIMLAKKGLSVMVREPEDRATAKQEEDTNTSAQVFSEASDTRSHVGTSHSKVYDPRGRDPLYALANRTCLWELSVLSRHFHPTVALYSNHLIEKAGEEGVPFPSNATNYDPLKNHTFARFLERFVNKNAKKVNSLKKGTGGIGQPRAEVEGTNRTLKSAKLKAQQEDEDDICMLFEGGKKRNVVLSDTKTGREKRLDDDVVGSASWVRKKEEEIPVDERFFWEFFSGTSKQKEVPKNKNAKNTRNAKDDDADADIELDRIDGEVGSDDEDVGSIQSEAEFDEDEVWKAMINSGAMHGVDATGEDSDEDLDFGDEDMDADSEEEGDRVSNAADSDDEREDELVGGALMDEMDTDGSVDSERDSEHSSIEEESNSFDSGVEAKRPRTQNQRILMAAKSLGYKGSWKPGSRANDFASAEDFESLVAASSSYENDDSTANESGGSEDELLGASFRVDSDKQLVKKKRRFSGGVTRSRRRMQGKSRIPS